MDKQQQPTFDNQLIELESVDSTNNYALAQVRAGLARGGEVYFAHRQWAGKGQRGKTWTSEAGQNVSMSLVLNPQPLPISRQFLLGAAVALGCLDLLQSLNPRGWTIKWPNDLFQGDRKVAGILIENVIQGEIWRAAIIGVGMNLNQTFFPAHLPHAISLKQITGRDFEPISVARNLADRIGARIAALTEDPRIILNAFNQNLYKRGEMVTLRKGDRPFPARIDAVQETGVLITSDPAGRFLHGEVEFVIG